jgi:hypothetical protein
MNQNSKIEPPPEPNAVRGCFQPNKWHYRHRVRVMPRMKNLRPYDSDEIAHWFSELYQCDLTTGSRHFHKAISLSAQSAKANPQKWPPFLLFDSKTREWHGADTA